MSALCGAFAWKGQGPLSLELTAVQACLAPYGEPRKAAAERGAWSVALAAHQNQPEFRRGPALVERANPYFMVAADVRIEHRRELCAALSTSSASSDAELILRAYERWGTSLIDHLRGQFAFAIFDGEQGGLLLARDHQGDRPLAIWEADGVLAFATTALALTGFRGVGHDLDMDRVADVVALGYGTDHTFVKGVRLLPPGSALWIDGSGIKRWRWWLPNGAPIVESGTFSDNARRLRESLEKAVDSSLEGPGSYGVLLSGGLDSTSVAALAARCLSPALLPSFTSVAPAGWTGATERGWISDERSSIDALVRVTPNLRPRFVRTDWSWMFDHCESLWELGSGPVRNALFAGWVFSCYQEAAADGVDVLLTGAAGNLGFSADGPMWLAELVRRGRLFDVWREINEWSAAWDLSRARVIRRDLLAQLFPRWKKARDARRTVYPLDQWIAASAILPERLTSMDLSASLGDVVDPHPKGFSRDTHRLFELSGAQNEYLTAVKALWGVELRDPTADRDLLELALAQPEWWRRHKGVFRAVCREAMRDILPPEVVDRRTFGAQMPNWFDVLTDRRDDVQNELEEMRDHPATRDVIDVARLERLVQRWPDRSQVAEWDIISNYKIALSRALMISRYMRWFEARGRRVSAGGPAVVISPH